MDKQDVSVARLSEYHLLPSKSGIYKITCCSNKKVYVGSSKNIRQRLSTHYITVRNKKHRNPHLQSAFDLYGESAFTAEVIELCSPSHLIEREQYWLDTLRSYDRSIGFNQTTTAWAPTGYKHTKATREKMSAIKKQQVANGKAPRNNLEGHRGRAWTEKEKKRLSDSRKGKGNPMYGYKESEESKSKRMKNMLSKPRWNKGLTKETDPRLHRMGERLKGRTPTNAITCTFVDHQTNTRWTASSLKLLAEKSPLSLPTIHRLKSKTAGLKTSKRYSLLEGAL